MRTRLIAVTLACVLAAAAGCSSKPEPDALPFDDYVALGDSFSAGPLIPPADKSAPGTCLRSESNYPSYLASYLKVKTFTDASCSGAETSDLYTSQDVIPALQQDAQSIPPQLDAVKKTTDLVTVGIGGNDYGLFGDLLLASVGRQNIDAQLSYAADVQGHVEKAIREIRKRAPDAKVLVVGYLRVFPKSGNCASLPLSESDRSQADAIQRRINRSLAEAAKASDATYVDAYALGNGHDVCADDEAWINGAENNFFAAAAFHPFRRGMDAVAREIYRTLTDKKPPKTPDEETLADVPR